MDEVLRLLVDIQPKNANAFKQMAAEARASFAGLEGDAMGIHANTTGVTKGIDEAKAKVDSLPSDLPSSMGV